MDETIAVEESTTKMDENSETSENQLLTYIQNILKYQIIPMDFMTLRDLVKEAPKNLNLYNYIEEKYPGLEFLEFLKKYPNVFTLNPDRTITYAGPSYCIQAVGNAMKNSAIIGDEVDGYNRKEYVSDSDSDSDKSDTENVSLLNKDNNQDSGRFSSERPQRVIETSSSSFSDSSVDFFSSEIVQTSDSNHSSSLSSDSSSEN
ncbi:uncharacterized protein LOC118199162 [Stegodyphus dumicola]|uniref:uncharacterized protein LOC118199162 n=1 Tax=Stegodyphus dumicola TaxID=202533 RepID=UPI0015A93875|nr:uncharacterized protein LOC118199162 [Stegodyphus dumicola]XP_035226855.1 uncharacterized protein LOC118199162 [Stegodyphus dumicola]XP_035226857.1 uncharacterized protein LOC118199162 [Stegodyphus dumicola]